jgi:hypothetical protein
MSDEPRVCQHESIERVRARLEALVMANAAPRRGARSKQTGKPCRGAAMANGRCKVHGGPPLRGIVKTDRDIPGARLEPVINTPERNS